MPSLATRATCARASSSLAALTGPDRDAGMEKVLAGIDKLTGVLGGLIPPLLTKEIDGKHA